MLARKLNGPLLALLLLSFALHFTGIASEIGDLYVGDEGIFRVEARRILGGEPFRPWFTYPHLLFYVDSAALWLADHLGPLVPALARWGARLTRQVDLDALVLRWVGALFGALTVLPVFRAGERLGGKRAAVLGSLAVALSPLYLEICHQNIADVPSAFFATICFAQLAGLAAAESGRGYALAGLAAGLAAGSKYPAGVVAIGIVAIWLAWRLRERRLRPGPLLLAGGIALAAFLATTPSLLLFPDWVFRGRGNDILFGVRQYMGQGWTGVVRESNLVYYGSLLADNFGWLVLVLGVCGATLAVVRRRRVSESGLSVAWLLVFPAVFLALMIRLNVAVPRNVMPVLPCLAVLLGFGLAELLGPLERSFQARFGQAPRRSFLIAGLISLCLVQPAIASTALLIRFSRPTTRELAASWIQTHLPVGANLFRESYTPWIGGDRFVVQGKRFLTRFRDAELRSPEADFLMLADAAYGRFLDEGQVLVGEESPGSRYRKMIEELPLVAAFESEALRLGPRILILANQPAPSDYDRDAGLELPGSWHEASIELEEGMLRATERGRVLFKLFLRPGLYDIKARGEGLADAGVEMISLRLAGPIRSTLTAGFRCRLELASEDKYFLYVDIPKGGALAGLSVEKVGIDMNSAMLPALLPKADALE